jgi:hypothetical protein
MRLARSDGAHMLCCERLDAPRERLVIFASVTQPAAQPVPPRVHCAVNIDAYSMRCSTCNCAAPHRLQRRNAPRSPLGICAAVP